jgi:GntR family histidine utilization transcriptional repressor
MTSPRKPRYQQLKEQIISRISSGDLQPLDRVPSEHELVASAGVSRMTANRALRELNDEGYVERVAGVGTFVADLKAASHVLEVWNIADEVRSRGHEHRATVLTLEARPAAPAIAEALHIAPRSDVNHVFLIHFENDVPIQVEDRYATVDFAPDFLTQDFRTVTPSAYLSSIAPLQEAEHVVRAKMPIERIRQDLKMKSDEPCLLVTRRTWVQAKPVSFARLYNPGNRFELTGHYAPPGSTKSHPKDTNITELRKID